jgi:hypothetical protein
MGAEDAVAQPFINEPWQDAALEQVLIEQLHTEELVLRCLIAHIVAITSPRRKNNARP